MDDLQAHIIRKRGEYTAVDVIEESQKTIKEHGAKRLVVIIQDDTDTIHRMNTELDNVELLGLLEEAKISEFL